MNDVTGEEMPVSGHCFFFFLILSCLSQTDVKQSGRVRLQNSAKILLLDPHLCTRILVSAMISLLKKPLSICQST